MNDDPYEILQVSRNAEIEVIQAAYRRLAWKYHPDVNPSPTADERMTRINWAYGILSDPVERERYDRLTRVRATQDDPTRVGWAGKPTRTATAGATAQASTWAPQSPPSGPPLSYPRSLTTVLIAVLLLVVLDGYAFLFDAFRPTASLPMLWIGIGLGVMGCLLLAITAAAGWDPARIAVWRTAVMLPLTFFSFLAWIPCYFAGKAIARKMGKTAATPPRKWPIALYAIGALALSSLLFGEWASGPPAELTEELRFSAYRDNETGITFEHPLFLSPQSETTRERTDIGTIFTVTTITAETSDPAAALVISIIEDPTRETMFPSLYPPDEDSLRAILISEVGRLRSVSTELSQQDLIEAIERATITTICGYPAAEYTVAAPNTSIGDALIRGALVVTDAWDVSVYLFGSVEPDVGGSLTLSQVEVIWDRLTASLELPR